MKTSDLDPGGIVAAWNALYPVGTPVEVWKGSLPDYEGTTTGPAALDGANHRPVVPVSGQRKPALLACITVPRSNLTACDVCGQPQEGHAIRYSALQGYHEWTDPTAKKIAHVPDPAREPASAPAVAECDCPPGGSCTCDPWENDPPTAVTATPELALPVDPRRPRLLARIFHAPRTKDEANL